MKLKIIATAHHRNGVGGGALRRLALFRERGTGWRALQAGHSV